MKRWLSEIIVVVVAIGLMALVYRFGYINGTYDQKYKELDESSIRIHQIDSTVKERLRRIDSLALIVDQY